MFNPNDTTKRSFVAHADDNDFSLQNLPFGIFSTAERKPRAGVAIGDQIFDLSAAARAGLLDELALDHDLYNQPTLNALMRAAGKRGMRHLRAKVGEHLVAGSTLAGDQATIKQVLLAQSDATMHLPVAIGDYTDFYSSEQHARNLGAMFRDPDNALLPNWKHIPVGYHGRASSIVVSGTDIRRPVGQLKPEDGPPTLGPSRLLDFELEMAFITFDGKPLGERISIEEADDYIFGLVLFNDWSARDIQKWEYVPLGPFLGKNFASSVSPWIVTLEALEPFRCAAAEQAPKVLDYLAEDRADSAIDLPLQVLLQAEQAAPVTVSNSNYKNLYWSMRQQLAHHTVNGCNIRCGDMMASGTISGDDEGSYGSMLEITWRGTKPVPLPGAGERKMLADGDTLILRGAAGAPGQRVGFGEVTGTILPAKD